MRARLPLQPLLAALRIDHTLARSDVPGPGVAAQAATLLGVSTRTIHRQKHTGISPEAADRLAIAAGLHPILVWGDAWTNAMENNERSVAGRMIACQPTAKSRATAATDSPFRPTRRHACAQARSVRPSRRTPAPPFGRKCDAGESTQGDATLARTGVLYRPLLEERPSSVLRREDR